MIYCDMHLHMVQCFNSIPGFASDSLPEDYRCCSCAHSEDEFAEMEKISLGEGRSLVRAFGVHPQNPRKDLAVFLETLLREKRISAVGEIGLDLFSQEYRDLSSEQEEVWKICLELSASYNMPVVIHNRKALDMMFRDRLLLKRLPAVVFHSFAFGPVEVRSLLEKGINAWFSFGKQLLNGNKKSIACVKTLPLNRLFLETDSPYQTLRGEDFTHPCDIKAVYARAAEIRGVNVEELEEPLLKSFESVFGR
ncbi:MAG: TatD family hydrolase [Treponema sp.]|nr:TatD family hydrolase [Treponema sp.]